MNYTDLITDITSNIKPNGHREITGQVLQDVLLNMADYFEMEKNKAKPLAFTCVQNGLFKLQYSSFAINNSFTADLEYSKNGAPFQAYTMGTGISCDVGDIVELKGNNARLTVLDSSNYRPAFNWAGFGGRWKLSGNLLSLVSKDNFMNITALVAHQFDYLFSRYGTSDSEFYQLKDASELILPEFTANFCYLSMFSRCSSLEKAPKLPAMVLSERCYGNMFERCTNLQEIPELPATTLATDCYYGMFENCTTITKAVLPAPMYEAGCYARMFYSCSHLNEIECHFTTGPGNENMNTNNWVYGVASTGTFKKVAGSTWPSGVKGIPNNWTEVEMES